MSRIISGLTLSSVTDLTKSDLAFLASTEALPSFSLLNCAVRDNEQITLADFKIQKNENLVSFNISGLTPLFTSDNNQMTHFPLSWSSLKKLTTVNLGNCGLSKEGIEDIVASFITAVESGLGQNGTGAKTLTITGNNARYPTATAGTIANDQLVKLTALGWTLQTNP